MKRIGLFLISAVLLGSCEMNTSTTKSKVDSTVNKLDSLAEKVGDKAGQVWDSTKAKAKDVKEGLDSTFDKR